MTNPAPAPEKPTDTPSPEAAAKPTAAMQDEPDSPFADLLRHIKKRILMQSSKPVSLRERLERSLLRDAEGRSFSPEERLMLANVLHLHRMRIDDVMVPRAEVVGVEAAAPLSAVIKVFRDSEHSRVPVFRDTLDDPVGLVHQKDLWAWLYDHTNSGATKAKTKNGQKSNGTTWIGEDADTLATKLGDIDIVRPVLFVPPSMHVADLLTKMQASRIHMALVIDEYGGTDGLLTIEDLVETVVGDIEDEHDNEAPLVTRRDDGTYVVDAKISLEDLEKATGTRMALAEATDDVDSLGGLVFTILGRVPVRGELITTDFGVEFEVLDADPRRIKSIRIHRRRSTRLPESQAAPDPG